MKMLKRLAWLRWPIAIGVLIALALHEGIADAFALIEHTGPVLLWLVPLHALPLLLDARAWHLLLDERIPFPALWWIAVVREAVGRLLPVLGIGGELAGIRLAKRYLPDISAVSATVIVEMLVTIAVQYALAVLGLAILCSALSGASGLPQLIAWALAMSLPVAIAAFVMAHRGAPFRRLEAIARRWLGSSNELIAKLDGARLDQGIRMLLQRKWLCLRAFAWQFFGYVLGALEVYWGFELLGHSVSLSGAVAIEALTQSVRNAVFFAPAGVGVQEAAIVAIASAFGVDRDAALSFALVRRAREFAWGGLALMLLRWVGRRPIEALSTR